MENNILDNKKNLTYIYLIVFLIVICLGLFFFINILNNKNKDIEINIDGINGLEVSLDAVNWSNKFDKSNFSNISSNYADVNNQIPNSLSSMSSAGIVDDGKLELFYLDMSNDDLTAIKENEINCYGKKECIDKHFVAFDLFLKVNNPSRIGLGVNSSVKLINDKVDKNYAKAIRIGFVNEGTVNIDASPKFAQSLNGGISSIIWEANANDDSAISSYQAVNREIKTPIKIEKLENSSYFTSINPNIKTKEKIEEEQFLMNIPAGITKVRIYMWLEGLDENILKNVTTSNISLNLELGIY